MFALQTESADQTNTLIRLFDRTDEYQEINDRLEGSKKGLATAVELNARRRLTRLKLASPRVHQLNHRKYRAICPA